jgi:Ni,Fe-hydrogenase III large subunit
VETPRGAATLRIQLDGGYVTQAELWSPSQRLAELISPVSEGRELADALLGIASLDLSPWELGR